MFTVEEQEMILAIQGLLGEEIDPYEALEVYEEMMTKRICKLCMSLVE